MNILSMLDIPRLYTALAQWGACVAYIIPNRKRLGKIPTIIYIIFALISQIVFQLSIDKLPIKFWVIGMIGTVILMFIHIIVACNVYLKTAIYYTAFAFIIAEFAASLEWQIHSYFLIERYIDVYALHIILLIVVYLGTFIPISHLERKHLLEERRVMVSYKEMIGAVVLSFTAFLISNLSFVYTNTPFSGRSSQEIFYIRTLVDFSAMVILYSLREQHHQLIMRYEIKSINAMFYKQYEFYKQSKENIELVNRKYHDLKHQIDVIRLEDNLEKKVHYINKLESGIDMYRDQFETGNSTLDIILTSKMMTCREYNINMTCVVDGTLLDFMDVVDICTIFGNALDNAIDSVKQLQDEEKRLIRVALYLQNNFVVMRYENYFENELKYENGLLITTKKEKSYHGYGIKSLKYTTEKNDGTMTIHTEDQWFILRIILPYKK